MVRFAEYVLEEEGGGPGHVRVIAERMYRLGFKHRRQPKNPEQILSSLNSLALRVSTPICSSVTVLGLWSSSGEHHGLPLWAISSRIFRARSETLGVQFSNALPRQVRVGAGLYHRTCHDREGELLQEAPSRSEHDAEIALRAVQREHAGGNDDEWGGSPRSMRPPLERR